MRVHPNRPIIASLALAAFALLAGCGGSDGSDGSTGSPGGATAAADAGAAADASDDATADVARDDVPTSGRSFQEALNADDLTPEQSSELQITLSVLGLDHPGHVSGSTIVAVTSESDLEDRQFTCIAAGQVTEDLYEVVVVDESGEVLDC